MTSINVMLAAAPARIAGWLVWWAGRAVPVHARLRSTTRGLCGIGHASCGAPWASCGHSCSCGHKVRGAVGRARGRPPVGYFGARKKCAHFSGTGWMSDFLPSDQALAVAPAAVNRKPQNCTFHPNSTFYRTQPHVIKELGDHEPLLRSHLAFPITRCKLQPLIRLDTSTHCGTDGKFCLYIAVSQLGLPAPVLVQL